MKNNKQENNYNLNPKILLFFIFLLEVNFLDKKCDVKCVPVDVGM